MIHDLGAGNCHNTSPLYFFSKNYLLIIEIFCGNVNIYLENNITNNTGIMAENTIERWLPVQGYPCYMVSDQGRVKSYRSADNPKILKPAPNSSGYESVTLTSGDRYGAPGSKKRTIVIHKLVAQAFVPNPDPERKKFVDHINTIRTDSRACNLRWVTALENYHNPLTLQHICC